MSEVKACSRCRVEKPATAGFFRSYNSGGRLFLRNRCRLCEGYKQEGIVLSGGASRKLPSEVKRQRNIQRCRENYLENRDERLRKMRDARKRDPGRFRESDRRSYRKNKAAGSEYQKRRWQKSDKAKAREALRRWRRKNPDKERALWRRNYEKNRAVHLARAAQWAKMNPQSRAAIANRRRAREMAAAGDYTKSDVADILREFGRLCFYCGDPLTKFHVDHFIPLVRGGSNARENLRLSCPSCNYSKSSRLPWEWMPERFARPMSEHI